MKTILKFASVLSISCIATLAAGPATAQEFQNSLGPVHVNAPPEPITGQRAIDLIALETDMTPRAVRHVMQHNPTQYYTFLYEKKQDLQMRQALGEERFSALLGGEPIHLYSEKVLRAAGQIAANGTLDAAKGLSVATNP